MKYNGYSGYKDSGIEWLGDVPEHWEVKKSKYIASINDEVLSENTDPNYELLYVDIGSIDINTGINIKESMNFETAPSRARRKVSHGDVILSTVRTYLRAIAPVINPERNLIVSTGFAVIRPRQRIKGSFAAFAFRASYFVDTIVANSVGVSYPAINASEIGNFKVPLPPLKEQHAIADFLDRKTAEIDALIRKKERLIELLKEKRTALISHAVTKGLNPDVKMKDSGVEWLGEMPKHWEVKRLRFIGNVNPVKSEVSQLPLDTEVSFVPMEAVCVSGGLRLNETKPIDDVYQGYTFFKDNDIIIAKITPCFENGKGSIAQGLTNGIGFGTTELHVVRTGEELDSSFFFYLSMSTPFRQPGEAEMYGAGGQKRVPDSFIRNYYVPLPPLSEQHAIANFLDNETAKIEYLNVRVLQGIEKLKEYRTALISAAVTGKIDVREAVA